MVAMLVLETRLYYSVAY